MGLGDHHRRGILVVAVDMEHERVIGIGREVGEVVRSRVPIQAGRSPQCHTDTWRLVGRVEGALDQVVVVGRQPDREWLPGQGPVRVVNIVDVGHHEVAEPGVELTLDVLARLSPILGGCYVLGDGRQRPRVVERVVHRGRPRRRQIGRRADDRHARPSTEHRCDLSGRDASHERVPVVQRPLARRHPSLPQTISKPRMTTLRR